MLGTYGWGRSPRVWLGPHSHEQDRDQGGHDRHEDTHVGFAAWHGRGGIRARPKVDMMAC